VQAAHRGLAACGATAPETAALVVLQTEDETPGSATGLYQYPA